MLKDLDAEEKYKNRKREIGFKSITNGSLYGDIYNRLVMRLLTDETTGNTWMII